MMPQAQQKAITVIRTSYQSVYEKKNQRNLLISHLKFPQKIQISLLDY